MSISLNYWMLTKSEFVWGLNGAIVDSCPINASPHERLRVSSLLRRLGYCACARELCITQRSALPRDLHMRPSP